MMQSSVVCVFLTSLCFMKVGGVGNLKHNVRVVTDHGPVEGFSIPVQYEALPKQRINVFLGIPYAKRPDQYSDWRKQFRFVVSSVSYTCRLI